MTHARALDTPTTTGPVTAWLALAHALDDLADSGRRTPCQVDPYPFTADDRADRREAEQACAACPVRDLCRTYAEAAAEPWFVWGGKDQAPTSYRRKEANQQ